MRIEIGDYKASIYPQKEGGYIGAISLGFNPDGTRRRITRKGKNKERVKDKLKKVVADLDRGLKTSPSYTVTQCVNDFLASATIKGRSEGTRKTYRSMADNQIIAKIGHAKLKDLTAEDVEDWLLEMAETQSLKTVKLNHNLLTRAIRMAERRDWVGRNVSALADTPAAGQTGRPSKSMSLEQAAKVIKEAQKQHKWRLGAYVILCLMSGIRTEEARRLKWTDVDLNKATVHVLRADRDGGDTKTKKSRRGLGVAQMAVQALSRHKVRQAHEQLEMGDAWQDHGFVFCHPDGTPLNDHDVRWEFVKITKAAGIGDNWVPRELRHTFVSLLSDHDTPIETIARLVGHSNTGTTERVYRHDLKPVITGGAEVMDEIFKPKSA